MQLQVPQGTRLASTRQVVAAYSLAVLLFIVTFGIGYLVWDLFTWDRGQTPAQRLMGLRCWMREAGQVPGREQMALRQVTGLCLNGQLLSGFFTLLLSKTMSSVGDYFAGTVVLYDPDGVLALSSRWWSSYCSATRPATTGQNGRSTSPVTTSSGRSPKKA